MSIHLTLSCDDLKEIRILLLIDVILSLQLEDLDFREIWCRVFCLVR